MLPETFVCNKRILKKICCVHDFFQMNPIKKGHLERTCRECIDLTWSQNLQKKTVL